MPIQILPASAEDAPVLAPVGELAFENDLLNIAILDQTKATPDQIVEARAWRIERTRRRINGEGKHFFKAIDSETGAIVGFAGAFEPGTQEPSVSSNTESNMKVAGGNEKGELEPPAILNKEFAAAFETKFADAKKKFIGERNNLWYLGTMVVHPNFQGRGIGGRLLDACIRLSDQAKQDMYLLSSPAGRKLYLKGGFEALGVMQILGEDYDSTFMLHSARAHNL